MTNPADAQRAQAREITRYWLGDGEQVMLPAPDGPWVLHADHETATAALREENAELRAQLSRAGNCADPAVCNAEIATLTTERDTLREAVLAVIDDDAMTDRLYKSPLLDKLHAALKEPR